MVKFYFYYNIYIYIYKYKKNSGKFETVMMYGAGQCWLSIWECGLVFGPLKALNIVVFFFFLFNPGRNLSYF